jgi:hypothetical protein
MALADRGVHLEFKRRALFPASDLLDWTPDDLPLAKLAATHYMKEEKKKNHLEVIERLHAERLKKEEEKKEDGWFVRLATAIRSQVRKLTGSAQMLETEGPV